MQTYLLRRLLLAVPTIIGVTVIIFVVMHILPGDPLAAMFGFEEMTRLTPEERAAMMHELGLDRPLVAQYLGWMKEIGSGSLGESFFRGDKVSDLIRTRGPITLEVGLLAVLLSWVVGLPVGVLSALRPNTTADFGARVFSILFLAIPGFWLGLLVVMGLVIWFGYKSPIIPIQIWQDPWANLQMVIGPALVLGLAQAAYIARMARSSLFEVIREDYIRTARAKGLVERLVLARHALPNAVLPVVTLSGVMMGFVLGGSVTIEKAFALPGLGRSLVDATVDRDMTVVQNLVLLYSLIFVTVNLAIDLSYAWLDPRIRLQ